VNTGAGRPGGAPGVPALPGRITVIAGVNGAGKSSIVGATIRALGGVYYNPDEAARALRAAEPRLTQADANLRAWEAGRAGLERAIAHREQFTFETTLGGATITALLGRALDADLEVAMHFVGLDSPERHIARVRSRVARGGHDIPEGTIRMRYRRSREHLVALLPRLTSLVVFDNSAEADPEEGQVPMPRRLLETASGRFVIVAPVTDIPEWARPIVAASLLPRGRGLPHRHQPHPGHVIARDVDLGAHPRSATKRFDNASASRDGFGQQATHGVAQYGGVRSVVCQGTGDRPEQVAILGARRHLNARESALGEPGAIRLACTLPGGGHEWSCPGTDAARRSAAMRSARKILSSDW
jgi:predicted ABC-type ATPase